MAVMAAGTSTQLLDEIGEDFLTCTICYNQFQTPKTLPCLHTFCEYCLIPLVAKNKTLRCPTCRKPFQLHKGDVSQLQTNFFINNLMDLLKRRQKEQEEKSVKSENVEESIDASPHRDEPWMTSEDYKEVLQVKMNELKMKEQQISDSIASAEMMKSDLEEKLKEEGQKVEDVVEDVMTKVAAEKERLIAELESHYEPKEKILQDYVTKMEKVRSDITSTYGYIETMMCHGNTSQLLSTQQVTINCIEQLISMDTKLQTSEDLLIFHAKSDSSESGMLGSLKSDVNISKYKVSVKKVPSQLMKGESVDLLLKIRDSDGKLVTPIVDVVAELQTPDRQVQNIQAIDNRDGTQILTVCGETEGKYKLDITMGGQPIPGSPFQIRVVKGLVKTLGTFGFGVGQFNDPWGLAIDKDGNIVTADRGNKRVQVIDWEGNCKRIHEFGSSNKVFSPCGVAVSAENKLFSLDVNNKQVVVIDENGHQSMRFGQNELKKPKAIAINPLDGAVYVTDRSYNNSYIRIYSQNGSYVRSIKFRGKPTDCCFNSDGMLYVTDKTVLDYQGVKVFDANSQYLRKIRDIGKVPLFNNPRGVTVDEDGFIYVCDEHRILKLNSTGDFVCRIDSRKDGLSYPSGIVVTRTVPQKLVVADKGNHCIKVFVL